MVQGNRISNKIMTKPSHYKAINLKIKEKFIGLSNLKTQIY